MLLLLQQLLHSMLLHLMIFFGNSNSNHNL